MNRTRLPHIFIFLYFVHCITAISVNTQSLLGCGTVSRPSRVFPYSPANYDFNSNTPATCVQACSSNGYAYASVSAGQLCFCGSAAANTTSLNLTTNLCEVMACTGDSTLYCGDIDYELVYTSSGIISSASVVLIGGTSSTALQINQNYQFNLSYTGAVSYINYLIDFGDGTTTGWISGTLNAATTIAHTFSKTGQFSISVAARSLVGMKPIMSAMTVVVSDVISSSDISLACPNASTTQKTISCKLTSIRGSSLTAQLNYDLSGLSYLIPDVPNTQYYTFGSSFVTNYPPIDISVNLLAALDIAILPQSTITVAGRIASIQFYSSTVGTVNIYLLRLVCTSPMAYCYETNTCGSCINPYSFQCSSNVYSTVTTSCSNATTSQLYQQSTYSNAQYQIVAQWTVTSTGTGYQQIVANSIANMMNHTALVGDILAFQGLSMGKIISTGGTSDYRCIIPTIASNMFTCSVGNLSLSTNYQYLLQVTIIQAVQIAPLAIYNDVGYFNVQGTITQNNVTSYSVSTVLPVVYGIQWIEITGPSQVHSNIPVTFILNLYPVNATAASYLWYINGNNAYNTTVPNMNVSFSSTGTYTIGCLAQNALSIKYNSTSILIEDVLAGVTLRAGNISNISTSKPLEIARFQLTMTSGSDYACRVNFDSSQSYVGVYFYSFGYIPGSYLTYQYLQPGVYNVSGHCENSISNASFSLLHYVQYPIIGLQLQQRGVPKNTNYHINFTIDQGTAPQFRVLVSGVDVNFTYIEQYNLIQTIPFPGQSVPANFTVEIYAWNALSSSYVSDTFSIVSPIVNPRVRSSVQTTSFPGPILFEYTMDSGANIDILFYFADTIANTPLSCRQTGDYPSNVWNSCPNSNHTFQIPGTLTIIVAFTNAIDTEYKYLTVRLSTPVNSIEAVTSLQIASYKCAAAYIEGLAIASFVIRASNQIAKPATDAQVIVIPDVINKPSVSMGPFQLTMNYFASPPSSSNGLNVLYRSPGNFTAIFQVQNDIDALNISCVVQVIPILQQVYYAITPLNWSVNSITPLQASVYVGDSNPGVILLTWDFGDGTVISRTRTGTQFDQADTESHRYSLIGSYTLTITAQGFYNTIINNFTVQVQSPVSSFIVNFPNITGSPSLLIYHGIPTRIFLNVQDTSVPSPSSPRLFIDYNDTNLLATNSVIDVTLPYTGSYTYVSAGIYFVNFTVYNYVSSVTQIIKIAINAPFNNYQFTVCYLLPTLTSSLYDVCNLTLYNGSYYIPKQSQLAVYVTWTNPSGVPEYFDVVFKNGSTIIFNQPLILSQVSNISQIAGVTSGSPLYRLVIDVESNDLLLDGSYTLEVLTHNPLYTSTYSLKLYIMSAIAGLSINDKNILVPINVPKTFYAQYQNFTSISCLYIKYSDKTYECYGDSISCSSLPLDLSSILSACPSAIHNFIYDNSSIRFSHTFNTSHAFLYAYAWNYITAASATAYFSFPLSTSDCNLPQIKFDVYNPVMRWARVVQRSEAFSVAAKIIFNCTGSLSNVKKWIIFECDVQTEQCRRTTALDQLVSQLSSAQTPEIYIKPQMLPIGMYLFNFTALMTERSNFLASGYTYVKIIRSNIQVNLLASGTSMTTAGTTQSLLFQPGNYSIDPDSDYFSPQDWSFQYFCRIYGQASYPIFNGQEIPIDSTLVDPLNPSCFVTPGNDSLFKYGPNSNESVLFIQPLALRSGRSYEFKAVVTSIYDTSLTYAGYVLVDVQDVESVAVSVGCVIKMCQPNVEYQRINPTTQALLTSTCTDNCDNATDIIIQWSVYRGFQTGYPNNDMKWILLANMSAFDNIMFYGRNTINFTVTNHLFLSYPAVQFWKFQALYIVTTSSGVATGSGAIRFAINSPPQNGTCTVSPTNGTSMTPFQLTCFDWSDSDGIASYSFYASTSCTSRIPVAFTTVPSIELYLPVGNQNDSYTVGLVAEIRDIYGAIATYNLSNVTVVQDEGAVASFVQLAQQSSTQGTTNNDMERLLYSGDQNMASQLILSLSQALNTMGTNTQENATTANIPAQNLFVSGLSSSPSNSSTTNASSNNTEVMEAYSAAVNTEANTRDYAVKFLNNLPITNIDSVKLQASTINYLTGSTSALTRDAITSAASKCNDLVNALGEMVNTVSYEDVSMAISGIAQVTSNVLVASNTALGDRGIVLDLDYQRANALPADYDTDIESTWANPNLFSDGTDYSPATIQKNRNLYYQQQTSNQVLNQVQDALSNIVNVLNIHMNVGQTHTVETGSIAMTTTKTSIDNLNSLNISQAAGSKINLPKLHYCSLLFGNDSCSNESSVTAHATVIPLAPSGINGVSQARVNLSRTVSLSLFDPSGKAIPVTNLPKPIEIRIPRDPSLALPPMTLENVTGPLGTTKPNNNRFFSLYFVNVTGTTKALTLSATFELQPDTSTPGYLIIYRFDGIPTLNSTIRLMDGFKIFCPQDQIHTESDGYLYSYFLDNTQTINHEYVIFGVRELNDSEFYNHCTNQSNTSLSTLPILDTITNFTTNYRIRSYTSACHYIDESLYWQSDGLVVGPQTSHTETQCFTTHLTSFAGGWLVLPAPINWNYVFANLDFAKNKTIYLTLILMTTIYIIFMIYARYKDKKDIEKLGVTPLPDNLLNDKYYYQMIVFTGFRKDSGTNSKVHFIISGDDEDSGVRTLEDPKRKILQRGGIDSFIMAVPKSLGRLNYMRIWHDNSGKGTEASWFLKYIIVRDLQTMEKNHFICQKWLGVEKDDGCIERLLPVAGESQKREFAYLLSKKTYHSMSDGHLWFSVFSRPPSTRFTRTQRCTCCFVLLLMSMLMNIMYYDREVEAKAPKTGGISMGPFYITQEQIAIGVIVELICFLPSTILVAIFRHLRPRRPPVSPVREALQRIQNEHKEKQKQAILNDIHPQLEHYIVNSNRKLSKTGPDTAQNPPVSSVSDKQNSNQKKKRQKFSLPWWFIFIAYGLSFIISAVAGFLIFARGIEFGDTKTGKWLTSCITGLFSSILLTQPVKVVLIAAFFALFIRRDDDHIIDNDDDNDLLLESNEEYLHTFDDGSLLTFRTKSGHIPLAPGELMDARQKRTNELKMWAIIRELFAYISFLWLLYAISYSTHDPNSFYLMNHLKRDFLELDNQTYDFTQIYRVDQYMDWLSGSFLSHIRATNWYNGDLPTNLNGYIDDKINRMLGWATMRQLRVKPGACKLIAAFQNITKPCEADYGMFNEDKRSFNPGWTSIYNSSIPYIGNYSASIRKAFMYNKSDYLDTYTYVGDHGTYGAGGYVYEFRGKMSDIAANLSFLRDLSWIDVHTRAVIIQMNLYNPNLDLFVFATILAEFSPTGAVFPSARFEPLSLANDFKGFGLFKFICAVVYMLFIIYYMQREIRSLLTNGLKYFRDFWSYAEIGIIACSWGFVIVFVWRVRERNRISTLFQETNGYGYVNLQFASYVNDILTFLLGFCCFFGTFKFLRLLRFNKRMSLLSSTIMYVAKDLISFTCMFSIVYLGYLALFYLLFYPKIWECSDPLKAAQMLFEMMLLKFNASDLNAADRFLGPLCFTLFIIFVVFICMNMFISIISDGFRVVRRNIALQHNEHEIVEFIINELKKWTGFGTTREMDRLHLNPFDGSNVHYHDPITSFPDKIDELIIALNKIYLDTKRNDTLVFRPIDEKTSEEAVNDLKPKSNKANKYLRD